MREYSAYSVNNYSITLITALLRGGKLCGAPKVKIAIA